MTTVGFSQTVKNNKFLYRLTFVLFIALTLWYLYIHHLGLDGTLNIRQIWGSTYQILAILGGITGLFVARTWGYKSIFGKAILFFAIGLLLQAFGQSVDSYYNFFLNASIPYPSLGDAGFFGSVIAYIIASVYLLKATGISVSIKSVKGKVLAICIPLILLVTCYFFFLQGYQFDWTNKLKIFLDFGYPLGQASYVSIALLAYLASKNYFGGTLRLPFVFLIVALIFQYFSDFTFLYQANANTWYVGGLNDYLYFLSYTIMTLALIYFGGVHKAILDQDK